MGLSDFPTKQPPGAIGRADEPAATLDFNLTDMEAR